MDLLMGDFRHTSEGFALQFIERYDEIASLTDEDRLTTGCDNWTSFVEEASIEQDDSGV
jgi:hypothetical protein